MKSRPLRRAVASAFLATLAAGCIGTSPHTQRVPSVAPARLLAPIVRAEDRRLVDEALVQALEDRSEAIRAHAVLALGRIRSPQRRGLIERALTDDGAAAVRAQAAFALGLLGDVAGVPALARAASDADASVRARVAEALGKLADAAGAAPLAALLRDPETSVRAQACLAAWRMPDPAFAVEALVASSAENDPELRFAAAYALARLGSAGSTPPTSGAQTARLPEPERARVRAALVAMATSRNPEIRMQVARGLVAPSLAMDAATLATLSADDDARVRINAARSLSYPGAPVDPFLKKALGDKDLLVVQAAAEGLARLRTEQSRELLIQGIAQSKAGWLRAIGLDALTQAEPGAAAHIALSLTGDPDPRVRAAVARALAAPIELPRETALDALLADPVATVQAAAVETTAGLDPFDPDLDRAVDSTDPILRGTLARVLGEWLAKRPTSDGEARATALSRLGALWDRAKGDTLPDARHEVLGAAARGGRDPGVHALLEAGLRDPDRQVRLEAIEQLRTVFDEDHSSEAGPASDRPLAEYEEILEWAGAPHRAVISIERAGAPLQSFTVELYGHAAPLTCWNFAQLAGKGFYDGLSVHRIVPNFVIQDGDPRGDGNGGPGYAIRDEIGPVRFTAGTIGMASAGYDTPGSQWFVTHSAQPHLDGRYTAFGKVTDNLEAVLRVLPGDRIASIRIDPPR